MARYDVHHFNGGLVVDLQNDLIDIPGSRVAAPLIPTAEVPMPTKGLHPQIALQGSTYVVAVHLLAATPTGAMGKPVSNLANQADEFTRALDLLFQGY